MELHDRIFVSADGDEIECCNEYEAQRIQTGLLDDAPEGTLVEVRVEFPDGDSWWFRTLRIGDTVFYQLDAATKYGVDANAIVRRVGAVFDDDR